MPTVLLYCYVCVYAALSLCLSINTVGIPSFVTRPVDVETATRRHLLYSVLLSLLWKNSCSYLDETLSCCVITTLNFLTDASVIVIYSFALTDSTEQFQAVLYCQLAPRTITVPLV